MNLTLIKKFAKKRAGGLKKLAADIGMSEANLHRCVDKNEIKAGDLELIASKLNVKVGVFFDETDTTISATATDHSGASVSGNVTVNNIKDDNLDTSLISRYNMEIEMLNKILEEKERTISILMEGRSTTSSNS